MVTTSSYLERPIRRYEEALSDAEKIREAEHRAAAKERQRKALARGRQRPAA